VSIAGPMTFFGRSFFATAPTSFLMVAGEADVVIDYAANAPLVLDRVPGGELVTIAGASHVGFDDLATGVPRLWTNPDVLACFWLPYTLDLSHARDVVVGLECADDLGTVATSTVPPCGHQPPRRAMDPARQQLITQLAVAAFFDARFAADPEARRAAAAYLEHDLEHDFPEASWAASRLPPPPRAAVAP
jgi:hypothetical protein